MISGPNTSTVEALIATVPGVSAGQLEWLALCQTSTSHDTDHAEAQAAALRIAGEAVPLRLMAYDRANRDSGLAAMQAGWGSLPLRDLSEGASGGSPVGAAIEALRWAASALTVDDIAPEVADVLSRAWILGLQLGSWALSARSAEVTFALDRVREGWAGSAQDLIALAKLSRAGFEVGLNSR